MNVDTTTHFRHDIEVFFDGQCPLCLREVNMIRRRDHQHRILFTDISSPAFDANSRGLTQQALMDEIHAELPDGTRIRGVEVFRRMYDSIGFGALVSVTRLWGVRQSLEGVYNVWARNRLRLTGRCRDEVCAV